MSYERGPRLYDSVPVQLTRDKRLSFRARGIAVRLLSNAPGFRMTAADLARETPNEGRFAVLSAMKELRLYGYAQVIRHQDERGRWNTLTRIYETPQPKCNDCTSVTEVQSPNPGAPNPGGPESGSCTPKSSSTKKEHQEEGTTTSAANVDWRWLPWLTASDRAVVVERLDGLENQQRQDLLDELAGAKRKGRITSEWPSWFNGLVANARKGRFQPSLALAIRAERTTRTQQKSRRPGESCETPYENAVNHARQMHGPNGIAPDKTKLDRLLADAAEKWPIEAKKIAAVSTAARSDLS